jgi:hypothetical protein
VKNFFPAFLLAGLAGVFFLVANPSTAQVESARAAGHNVVACSDSTNTAITVPLADVFGNASSQGAQLLSLIASSATPVYVYSKNSEAATEGVSLCTAAGCVASIDLPGPASLWYCKSSSGSVNINVLGTTR